MGIMKFRPQATWKNTLIHPYCELKAVYWFSQRVKVCVSSQCLLKVGLLYRIGHARVCRRLASRTFSEACMPSPENILYPGIPDALALSQTKGIPIVQSFTAGLAGYLVCAGLSPNMTCLRRKVPKERGSTISRWWCRVLYRPGMD